MCRAWRDLLIGHALHIRRGDGTGSRSDLPAAERAELDEALGPMAEEAMRIVESYALGARSQELGADGRPAAEPPPEFLGRLNIILNGLEPAAGRARTEQAAPQVIQSELWQLLYKVRESAELAYSREVDLVELDRRILLLLLGVGPLVPADISSAVGADKAQVSRSVKRLLELKMIERAQIRARVELTRRGLQLSERLTRLADLRNRELTFDIGDAELAHFFSVIETLLDRAVQLYERERSLNQGGEKTPSGRFPLDMAEEARTGEPLVLDRTRIIPPLMALSSYFSRSGSLTFKRLTSLSSFEAWVLNEVSMDPPIEWNRLVSQLDRDHSQAGRTINALMERGLVERDGGPGRRHGSFSPTTEGRKLYDIIQEASRQRSAFLLAPLSQADRDRFLGTFDKIRRNAVVQLERERAVDELERG
jgi:DNA-binding MarR family transcriptional regulator